MHVCICNIRHADHSSHHNQCTANTGSNLITQVGDVKCQRWRVNCQRWHVNCWLGDSVSLDIGSHVSDELPDGKLPPSRDMFHGSTAKTMLCRCSGAWRFTGGVWRRCWQAPTPGEPYVREITPHTSHLTHGPLVRVRHTSRQCDRRVHKSRRGHTCRHCHEAWSPVVYVTERTAPLGCTSEPHPLNPTRSMSGAVLAPHTLLLRLITPSHRRVTLLHRLVTLLHRRVTLLHRRVTLLHMPRPTHANRHTRTHAHTHTRTLAHALRELVGLWRRLHRKLTTCPVCVIFISRSKTAYKSCLM